MSLTRAHRLHAASHHGVLALGDLRRLGATDHQIEHMTRTGELVRPAMGVYVLNGAPPSYEQRVAIACAADPCVVASHRAAGRLIGLRRLGSVDLVEVVVPAASGVRLVDTVVHRTKRLGAHHIVERPDGIRHTTPARTAFDIAGMLDDDAVESIVEQILDRGWHTLPQLFATERELRARGRPGSARFGRVLESRPTWRRPANSDLEARMDRELRRRGFPPAKRRVAVTIGPGKDIQPDLWWPDLRLALEIDHVTWHGGRLDAQNDKRRDRRLARLGIQTIRVTDEDVRLRLASAADDVVAIAAWRRRSA